MKTKKIFFISTFAWMLIASGCKKTDYAEAILGKWERIAWGASENNLKTVEPNDIYMEFLPDGIRRIYDPKEDELYYGTYKIGKTYIYYNYEKTYEQGRYDYKYEITKDGHLKMTFDRGDIPIHMYPSFINNKVSIYQPKN